MGLAAVDIFTLNAVATSAIAQYRCVGFDDAQINAIGADVKGISKRPAAIGEAVELAAIGTAIIESGGAFAVGAPLMADALGRVVVGAAMSVGIGTLAVGAGAVAVTSSAANGAILTGAPAIAGCELPQHLVGYALTASTAAGQFIEVKLSV